MLIRHSVLYVVAKLAPGVLGMATTAVLTRVLLPAQYGLYGLSLVIMIFGSTIIFDWLGLTFLRIAQRYPDRATAESTFVRMFLALVLATAALGGVATGTGVVRGVEAHVLQASLVMMWAYAWFELMSRFEVAELRPWRYLLMNMGRGSLAFIGAGSAAWLTHDAVWTVYGAALATLAAGCFGGVQRLRLRRFDVSLARSALGFGLPLAASLVLTGLIVSGTRALLTWLDSVEALGLYTAGFVLVQNTLAVAAAGLSSAGFSLAVRAVEAGDAAAARKQLEANGGLMLAVLAPVAVGMALTADGIAHLLVGPLYVGTVTRLTPWMAAGAFLAGFQSHYLHHAFHLGRRMTSQIWVTAGCVVVTFGSAAMLIPRYGAVGAAMAMFAGAATSTVHAVSAGRTAYPIPLPWSAAWRVALACVAMSLCVVAMPGSGILKLVLQTSMGIIAYGSACVCFDVMQVRSLASGWFQARRHAKPGAAPPTLV